MPHMVWQLLCTYSWQEVRHHAWRNAAAVAAVMLGVALALSVHLINASALDDFTQGMQSLQGRPDLEVRPARGAWLGHEDLARFARHPDVELASPVGEATSYALAPQAPGGRVLLRLVGVDPLLVARTAPDLLPLPRAAAPRLALLTPDAVFLNPAAEAALGAGTLNVQQGLQWMELQVQGSVRAAGPPMAVMDIAAWQDALGHGGQISRIDLRLRNGVQPAAWAQAQMANRQQALQISPPGQGAERMQRVSRAYRVNLTVLALIALFTGSFLVFSVLSQSVARRAPQLALLAVLGLRPRDIRQLVLAEALVLGILGSLLGVALGTGLAGLGLRWLGGDLGGGFFAGNMARLQWSGPAALAFAALGVTAAMAGAWWPSLQASRWAPAPTLKGLGAASSPPLAGTWGLGLLVVGALLTLAPPLWDMPLAAYVSIALLLVGGIVSLPWLVGWMLDRLAPLVQRRALWLLPLERARRVRSSAAVAVSGVVAALSLAVALTVMVASFRLSVMQWLDGVLPADLYVRASSHASASEAAYFERSFVEAVQRIPGVLRALPQRIVPLTLDPERPAVTLLCRSGVRSMADDSGLPLIHGPVPVPKQMLPVVVSEAVVDLYGAALGQELPMLADAWRTERSARFFVAGIWRDYARQFGTIAVDADDCERLSGDTRSNDIAFWLQDGVTVPDVQTRVMALADQTLPGSSALLEFGSAAQIRATSLRIFDRSFAVTYWLQAVAIGIGLFGVAASFSAQVLARRKEFGLLAHLGLTRRQILAVVALEGAAWTTLGALAGSTLGLAVGWILVNVVNPQSFHWSMELHIPGLRLLALALAVVLSGTLTAWLAGRAAASRQAVMAVKEDW